MEQNVIPHMNIAALQNHLEVVQVIVLTMVAWHGPSQTSLVLDEVVRRLDPGNAAIMRGLFSSMRWRETVH